MVRQLDPKKRETFLQTALHLFVEQGISSTSTAQIAREAGTASGTLFLYFPTKEDLINTLLLELAQAQSESINAQFSPTLSAYEMFRTIWEGTIAWFDANPEAYQYILQVRDSGLVSVEVEQKSAISFAFYYKAIQQGLADGEIKPYPVNLIGDFLYHDMVAVMNTILRMRADTDVDLEAISRMGFDIFWDGIKVN